ncbi:hypothetical protein E2C01_068132 [Portunus trituberculatus]|uniref:Uncharacterized protein n=1 Tax=Portunus trituberculatus TaxID=210409 RepID=A0A5B7HVH1_PORTR|nr:hypothetical protein [Portunus trituberculatus]
MQPLSLGSVPRCAPRWPVPEECWSGRLNRPTPPGRPDQLGNNATAGTELLCLVDYASLRSSCFAGGKGNRLTDEDRSWRVFRIGRGGTLVGRQQVEMKEKGHVRREWTETGHLSGPHFEALVVCGHLRVSPSHSYLSVRLTCAENQTHASSQLSRAVNL